MTRKLKACVEDPEERTMAEVIAEAELTAEVLAAVTTEAPAAEVKAPARKLKVAVVGSRSFGSNGDDVPGEWDLVTAFCSHLSTIFTKREVTFVSGGARGVDAMAKYILTEKLGYEVQVVEANWEELGPGAGYARNWEVVMTADVVAALWDGESRGTAHVMACARRLGKQVIVWKVPPATKLLG